MFWQQRLYGYRVIVYVRAERLYLQSRSGADLTSHFPELQAAAGDIGEDWVLDGELVVLHEDRLDFAALQQRARLGGFRARSVARVRPAHVVTIDLLEADGEELLASPYRGRWARLETLFTGRKLAGRWALVGSTPTARRRWPGAVSASRAWSRNRPPTATGPARGLVEGPVPADGEAVVGRPAETRRTPHSGRARPPLDRRSVQLSLGSEGSVGTRPSRASLRRGVRQRHLHGRCGPVPASRRLRTTARGPHPGYGAASG
ncbi:ATP-dependent DNA ligase [Streptomyces diastaticus]